MRNIRNNRFVRYFYKRKSYKKAKLTGIIRAYLSTPLDVNYMPLLGSHQIMYARKNLDSTQLYLNQIGKSPLLTAKEEVYYSRLQKKGDESARKRMIESNLRLVVKIARRYLNRGLPLLDLIEEGNLGLIRAVEKFDPEKGFRFSTYATYWIKQFAERAIMNQSRTIRLPIHVVKELNVYLRASRELTNSQEHEPTPQEIADKIDCPVENVNKLFCVSDSTTSYDSSASSDPAYNHLDALSNVDQMDPYEIVQHGNATNFIEDWLFELTDRHREVICRRFGLLGHEATTLRAISEEIGLTRERIRQIQVDALKRLRVLLDEQGFNFEDLPDRYSVAAYQTECAA